MPAPHRRPLVRFATALLFGLFASAASAEPAPIDSIKEMLAKLRTCWKPPPASRANPGIDVSIVVSFSRDGNILGRPRITYESSEATDDDRLLYRIAVMEALQRCTPMPFTEGMAGAVAGRPFNIQFQNRKRPPQPTEKRAWLTPKIL